MIPPQLLAKLGLFVKEDFLAPQFCGQFLVEAQSAAREQSSIWQQTPTGEAVGTLVDETARKTRELEVSSQTLDLIKQRLRDIKPELEQFFQVQLGRIEYPSFYHYEPGDFFKVHRDRASTSEAPEEIQKRQVSVVMFLNSHAGEPLPDTYRGGVLTFYGLLEGEQWQVYGFPLIGLPGSLVAFRSDVWHEVKPVLSGSRYTIVSWFLQAD
jgi:SM-20-related protein